MKRPFALFNEAIHALFYPDSVAVIGASSIPGKIGHEILRSISQHEYRGKVYAVNPKAAEILGLKSYESIEAIPDRIDLAVLAIPAPAVPEAIEKCASKGAQAAVIVSGGFKELGGELEEIEKKIVRTARMHNIRIIGPNCIGIFNSSNRLDTFFQSHDRMRRPERGPVAFMTQSGTFGCTILEWAAEANLGISKFISYGNRCDVDEADLIDYLAQDDDTKVIGVYVEGFGDGRKFMEAVRRVVAEKPVVVLKAGRSEKGSKVALSHTGWLAGSYEVCESALKQCDALVVHDIAELFDVAKALAKQPVANGRGIAMATNGIGPCVMAADRCVELGLDLPRLEDRTLLRLRRELPSYCVVNNPVDLTGSGTSRDYMNALMALAEDRSVDLLMPFFVFQDTPLGEEILDLLPSLKRYGKPILCCASGGEFTRKCSDALEWSGIPVYPTPERVVAAAKALVSRGEFLKGLEQN
jgi:3-hydroxypropionyl-CoA synthetase (ADP-forming)